MLLRRYFLHQTRSKGAGSPGRLEAVPALAAIPVGAVPAQVVDAQLPHSRFHDGNYDGRIARRNSNHPDLPGRVPGRTAPRAAHRMLHHRDLGWRATCVELSPVF